MMKFVRLNSGRSIATLGLGTWRLGESRRSAEQEVAALRDAIDLGYRLFDTAEMYGEGGAETILGRAIGDALRANVVRREELFIVSKVYPHNAHGRALLRSCDASRQRLDLDCIDLYLLHWRGEHPLPVTIGGFEDLLARGAIGAWGVSNFDVDDLEDLWRAEGASAETTRCATNQVYYSLATRGPEFSLTGVMGRARMPLMAYTPLDLGKLATAPALLKLGQAKGVSSVQLALAWLLQRDAVIAIPKSIAPQHLRDNLAATAITLDAQDLGQLERAFPAPRQKRPLAMV